MINSRRALFVVCTRQLEIITDGEDVSCFFPSINVRSSSSLLLLLLLLERIGWFFCCLGISTDRPSWFLSSLGRGCSVNLLTLGSVGNWRTCCIDLCCCFLSSCSRPIIISMSPVSTLCTTSFPRSCAAASKDGGSGGSECISPSSWSSCLLWSFALVGGNVLFWCCKPLVTNFESKDMAAILDALAAAITCSDAANISALRCLPRSELASLDILRADNESREALPNARTWWAADKTSPCVWLIGRYDETAWPSDALLRWWWAPAAAASRGSNIRRRWMDDEDDEDDRRSSTTSSSIFSEMVVAFWSWSTGEVSIAIFAIYKATAAERKIIRERELKTKDARMRLWHVCRKLCKACLLVSMAAKQ